MSRTPVLPAALLSLVLAAPAAPALADPVAGTAGAGGGGTVTLRGHGYGHGHGLSQYGAQKAARSGRSYREILRFYYPRTRLGKAGGAIRVQLTGDRGDDLVVEDRAGLRVRGVGNRRSWPLDRRGARRWRITPTADAARSVVSWRGTGRWHEWRTLRGDAELTAGGGPIRLLAEAGPATYRGTLRSASTGSGGRDTVNLLPLEHYLRGVVPQEVPALWKPAAVRAQAVAARTYAAFERRASGARHYDLCDTAHCQVYGGAGAEHPASDAAIRATRKQVVTRRGRPIFAQFNASSGGWTADGGRPYLVAKRDRWDDWAGNPYHDWRTSLTAAEVEQQWPGIGSLRSIRVDRRDGHGDWNGRVLEMTLAGSEGEVTVSGDTFRVRFGLRSTWFRVTTDL